MKVNLTGNGDNDDLICRLHDKDTVPLRRNLTGNANTNGHENANGTGIERIQKGYQTDIERIQNTDGTQTIKAFYKRTRSSEHMLHCSVKVTLSELYDTQSAYQGFENNSILTASSSHSCPAQRSLEINGANHLMSFFISFTHTKQASTLRLVHFVFVAAILLLSTSPSYAQTRK